jgi:hypothetical protein
VQPGRWGDGGGVEEPTFEAVEDFGELPQVVGVGGDLLGGETLLDGRPRDRGATQMLDPPAEGSRATARSTEGAV